MNYKIIKPPQQLADYVRFFWFLEGNIPAGNPFTHHAFAYPCPEIVFCYKGQFKYQMEHGIESNLTSGIYGQTQTFSKVSAQSYFGVFGFYLYPHALPQLFGLPANELTNQSADIKTFCGKDGEILEEKVMLAIDNDHRLKIICDFLEERLKNVKTGYAQIHSSIKSIAIYGKVTTIKTLLDESFLSTRQFERKFKEFSGFNPKLFLRITRFNSLLNKDFTGQPLANIAYEHGYYDQSHFIHDFQKFSGSTPKEYFKLETLAASNRGTYEF